MLLHIIAKEVLAKAIILNNDFEIIHSATNYVKEYTEILSPRF